MIEEFTGEGWRDFQARYQGTYGWYEKANGKKLLVLLSDISDQTCKFLDADGGVFTAVCDKGNKFHFLPTKRGLYYSSQGIVFCQRIPAKQYKRGLASSNTQLIRIPENKVIHLSFEVLEEMFSEDKHPEYIQQYRNFERADVIFDDMFAFAGGRVWLYGHIIGLLKPDRIELQIPLFKQEIEDIVNKHHFNYLVEVAK